MSTSTEQLLKERVSLAPGSEISRSSYRGVLRQPRVTLAPTSRDQVTPQEAAVMLGCSVDAVCQLVVTAWIRHGTVNHDDALLRTTVEDLATEVYSWRLHLDEPDAYWITGQRAARALGVSRARLSQLADANRVPFVRHQDGTRLYRRRQLEMIAETGTLGRPVAGGLATRMHVPARAERLGHPAADGVRSDVTPSAVELR